MGGATLGSDLSSVTSVPRALNVLCGKTWISWGRISARGILLLAAFSVLLPAAEYNVQFSPPNTTITWELGSALHTVHGTFQLQKGDIWFDPQTGAMRGELTVAAASGESSNGLRDKRMRNSVLEADQYPAITFKPSRAEGPIQLQGKSELKISGTFTIHGKDHPIVVPAKTVITGDAINAVLDFSIPYVEWGMKDPSTLMLRVDKAVKLQIKADGHLGKGL